jgi:hypothetical protein
VEREPAEREGCGVCGVGRMEVVEVLAGWARPGAAAGEDSS